MEKINILFDDMTHASRYIFLEVGKDDDELKEIALKWGLQVPSKDLSIFKGRYAFVDRQNKNGCTLPKKEVRKALKTLTGKAIDKDHLRKSTIGFWFGASLDDDEIISYGALWKSNFPEDYDKTKENLQKGRQKISFEAWGDREFNLDKSYDLKNIEFAGGALLYETDPAFEDAEVLEMSSKILEFAKVLIEEEKTKLNFGVEKKEGEEKTEKMIEEAKMNFMWDENVMARMMSEAKCPTCDKHAWFDVNNINFDENKIDATCPTCSSKLKIDLTPSVTVTKKGKKPEKANGEAIEEAKKQTEKVKEIKNKIKEMQDMMKDMDGDEKKKMTMKIKDMEKEMKMIMGEKIDTEEGNKEVDEILKKYNQSSVEELAKSLDKELDTLKASIVTKDQEIATLKTEKETLTKNLEEASGKLKIFEDEKAAQEKAKKDEMIKARKEELGEFAKDMKDEDILDELKYENAKLKKENATLKKDKPTSASIEAGAKDENVAPSFDKQSKIRTKAFGK